MTGFDYKEWLFWLEFSSEVNIGCRYGQSNLAF